MDREEEKLVKYLESLPRFEAGEDFADQVMCHIEERKKRPSYAPYKKWVVVALAAIFLLLVFLSDLPLLPRLEISPSLGYRKVELVFYSPAQNPRTVAVAGEFSSWDPLPMNRVNEECWKIQVELKPGKYQYGFLIDGEEWIADPASLRQVPDGFGKFNSVLVVNGEYSS
ncbi:MAG TPA: isoamylase early set domain-containing protein [Candidatus Atribacteria bacterium]|nr:isoamylase early set domain-containing protein [Candidatus Atribacteria bacterium]HQE24981.1 isoamylase early set domain-containing protein [Candidatus Atribacteria bacterium]